MTRTTSDIPDPTPRPRYICVHGHFYQPPRENPWLGAIEEQPSAAPFHDWNARIASECYGPNTAARVVDNANFILDIRNNFERISFNFGPTLLVWLEEYAPDVYERILEADRRSLVERGGHGNAVAQVYNHVIMPLADRRDKTTQVLWGLEDFRRRFRRDPEGMWLSETAVDLETLEVLADCGLRYTVLAPHQAEAFRALAAPLPRADGDVPRDRETPHARPATATPAAPPWALCDRDAIDPTRAYHCALPSGKSIVLFFYDGPISRAVAFEDLLSDGVQFAQRLMDGFRDDRPWPQLLSIATDGETYGHHHRYGEMALAYALYHIKSRGAARLTNFGEYLELHPPAAEVRLREDTSWSCAHGIERWRSDCGCNMSNTPGWNQKWRRPLRAALDALKRRLDEVFAEQAARYVVDPWKARDDYIHVVLDRRDASIEAFLDRHARQRPRPDEVTDLLRLLEMQHHALLMFTSCAWFFDELSGIETLQNLQYASRAIQLASQFQSRVDAEFRRLLDAAPSNAMKNGRAVWTKKIDPAVVDLDRVVAHWAIARLYNPTEGRTDLFCYEIEMRGGVFESFGQTALGVSQIRVFSKIDRSSSESVAAVLHFGGHDFHGALHGPIDPAGYNKLCEELLETFKRRSLTEVVRTIDERFDAHHYTINDLFAEERRAVLARVTREAFGRFQSVIDLIYDENRRLMEYIRELGAPLPRGFLSAAEETLAVRLERAIQAHLANGGEALDEIAQIVGEAGAWDIALATPTVVGQLQEALHRNVQALRRRPTEALCRTMLQILDVVESLEARIDLWEAQNACFCLIYNRPPSPADAEPAPEPAPRTPEEPPPPTPRIPSDTSPDPSEREHRPPVPDTLEQLALRLRIVLDSPMRHPDGSSPGPRVAPPLHCPDSSPSAIDAPGTHSSDPESRRA